MRPIPVTTARADWYDRNPIARSNSYFAASVAPHANTNRWSYTVPAGTKFALQATFCALTRDAAAGTASFYESRLRYTPSGGSIIDLNTLFELSNTVGNSKTSGIGGTVICLAGDVIQGDTLDSSTTGSVSYLVSMQGLEYDA